MKTAAANPNGAVGAFMGMGMAGGMAGAQMGTLYQQGAQQQAAQAAPAAAGWTCSCGQTGNTGKFCANCGKPAPVSANEWTQLRREEHGQILLELRQARARERVDVRLRHEEQGQVLLCVRREKARRCPPV